MTSGFTVYNNQPQRQATATVSRPTTQPSESTRPAQPSSAQPTSTFSAFQGKGTVLGGNTAPIADVSINTSSNTNNIYSAGGSSTTNNDNKKKNDKYQQLKEEEV